MRSRDTIRLRVFRYFERYVQPDDQPRTIADVAVALGFERCQAEKAVKALLALEKISVCGGSARRGLLYCAVPGSSPPEDLRGKHKQHQTGAAWAAVRKRRSNLSRARAARQRQRAKAQVEADLPAFARWLG